MACPDHRDDNEILLLLLDSLLRATERNRGNIMVTKVSNQLQPESEQKWSLLVGVWVVGVGCQIDESEDEKGFAQCLPADCGESPSVLLPYCGKKSY
jgi:hypothetical protein